MILVIENHRPLEAVPASANRGHECSLQQTLRRMGFHAAREAQPRAPVTAKHATVRTPGDVRR